MFGGANENFNLPNINEKTESDREWWLWLRDEERKKRISGIAENDFINPPVSYGIQQPSNYGIGQNQNTSFNQNDSQGYYDWPNSEVVSKRE